MLEGLGEGDVVVVCRLDSLGRSLHDVVRSMQPIKTAGAGFRGLAEVIDTTTPAGRVAAQLVCTLAELNRTAARERINTGLVAARAGGRVGHLAGALLLLALIGIHVARSLHPLALVGFRNGGGHVVRPSS